MARKRTATRAEDEAVLRILAAVAQHGPSVAGDRLGVARPYCSVLRQRVMADDLAMSGEDPAVVRAAYGSMRGGNDA